MRYVDTGTAKQISKIGLGTWQFGSREWGYGEAYSERDAYTIVRRALDLGVTLFDTAEIYGAGRSERILGHALGDDRESVVIADKIFPLVIGGPLVKRSAMASASRLGVSRLDLYQVHYPNPLVSDRVIMRGMRSLRQTGLIGEVGVSNYSPARWRAAENALRGRVLSDQVEYSLVNRSPERDVLPFAEKHRRVVIAYSPLGHGLLSGMHHGGIRRTDPVRTTSSYFRPENIERTIPLIMTLREVARAHSATPAQIALAWVIRHPAVVAIPGASSVEQLESNVAAAELQLAGDEYDALRRASAWSSRPPGSTASLRGRLSELRHCGRGGRYLAETLWQDHKLKRDRGG